MTSRDEDRTVGADGAPASGRSTGVRWTTPNGWFVGPREAPDRYELLGEGMAGGEGVTWRARYHGGLDAPLPLAVKVLHRPGTVGPGWPSEAERSRWRDQAALLRHLRLDHIVRVNEILTGPAPHRLGEPAQDGDCIILEMEWVDGPTLADLVRGRPTTPADLPQRLDMITDACAALSQLHSHTRTAGNPSVHRDVTPSNCIVSAERGLVLIDVSSMQLPRDGIDLTGRHTPPYSAPEVLSSPTAPRKPSADVYAVGALGYFCLTGQDPPPPTTPSAMVTVRGHLDETARRMGWASDVATHVLWALDAEPSRRPADLQTWAAGLRRRCTPPRTTVMARSARRPRIVVPLVVLALGAASATTLVALQRDQTAASAALPLTTPRRTPPAGSSAPSTAVLAKPVGRITAPKTGASVKDCSYFSGTARLPPGVTLVLASHNLSNGDPIRYMQVTFGFDHPENLSTWRGALFFNEPSAGQTQSVELIALTLEQARTAHNADYRKVDTIVRGGKILDTIEVTRASGPDHVTNCAGP